MFQHSNAIDHPEYNSTAIEIRQIHEDLMIVRVEPDASVPDFEPGQYMTLGLFTDERRLGGESDVPAADHKLIRRAYSISCPVLNAQNQLVSRQSEGWLEFYIALVRRDSDSPPALTPRLFAMEAGHRLFMGLSAKGTYTLAPVGSEDDVVFVATGTGEAPHNAMIRELLSRGHKGRIASLVCVRHRRDLAYLETHRILEKQYSNYVYIPLTTREPENTDPSHPRYVGKKYLQDLVASHKLERTLGWKMNPDRCHVFLCGNPSMIGVPRRDSDGLLDFPDPKGMVETLTELGFQLDRPHSHGNMHFEKYW